jgi:hypothetical protein
MCRIASRGRGNRARLPRGGGAVTACGGARLPRAGRADHEVKLPGSRVNRVRFTAPNRVRCVDPAASLFGIETGCAAEEREGVHRKGVFTDGKQRTRPSKQEQMI